MNIEVIDADFKNPAHGTDLAYLMNCYSQDPMGNNTPLSDQVQHSLANALSKIPHAFSVISYVDQKPAGLINCFEAFSTFQCKPLINIHDIIVSDEFRGLGISQLMLKRVEHIASEKGCCKMTLEVLEGNQVAQNSYRKFGFESYELDPAMGKALFWQKSVKAV